MRKKLVAVGTAIGVAALPLTATTPAAATTVDATLECSNGQAIAFLPAGVTANVGDQIRIDDPESSSWANLTLDGVDGPDSFTGSVTFTVTSASGGSIEVPKGTNDCLGARATLEFVPGGGGSSSTDASSGPAPAMQQFGKPESMTCDEAQPEGLNWSGVPSGGWGESWAQWMNGGNGGTICTRELVYRAGTWAIN